MARELGREGFGAFMFALGLTGALLIGAGFGTDELTAREVARDHSRAGRYLSNVSALKTASAVVLLALAVLISQPRRLHRRRPCGGGDRRLRRRRRGDRAHLVHDLPGARAARPRLAVDVVQRTLTAVVGIIVLRSGGGVVAASVVFAIGAVCGLAVSELSVRRLIPRRPPAPAAHLAAAGQDGVPDRRRVPALHPADAARRDAAVVPRGRGGGRPLRGGLPAGGEHPVRGLGALGGDDAVAGAHRRGAG